MSRFLLFSPFLPFSPLHMGQTTGEINVKRFYFRKWWLWTIGAVVLLAIVLMATALDLLLPVNPFPELHEIQSVEISESGVYGRNISLPRGRFAELRELFDGSRRDVTPAKWKLMYEVTVKLSDGETVNIDVFSRSGNDLGLFKVESTYYRGGKQSAFRAFLRSL